MLRTHTCGELRLLHKGKAVSLCGWNDSRRDHGGVIFIDLRDRYGLTQVVFDPSHKKDVHKIAEHLSREDVLRVTGKIRPRGKGLENPKMITGQIEILVDTVEILGKAKTPPIEIDDHKPASEEVRLKYRYLDLRRPSMQQKLQIRHTAAQTARAFLSKEGFLEIETPLLLRSTPEGARDYVVPSRVNPGKFYALPQSPQLYKQILMVSGCDKYFQLPKCLRDEDLRTDRQPEHTQIDIEMSFVELEDMWQIYEKLLKDIFKKAIGKDIKIPFKRLTYAASMDTYGTDKPDLRFGLELVDLSSEVKGSDFGVFNSILEHNGLVKCVVVDKTLSRNDLDSYITFCQEQGAKGMAWMKVTGGKLESNIVKFFSPAIQKKILQKTKAKEGSILMFIADKPKVVNGVLARLRNKLGEDLGLIKEGFNFVWITDFPLFDWDDETEKWEMAHHMFCMPKKEHLQFLKSDPGKVLCTQYDLVLNGVELGSGSLRITDPKVQEEVMKVIGFSHQEAHERFGFLLEAFQYGAPPHGGIGLGFDRIVALLCGTHDIREVIAFPKNKAAECPMDGSPSLVKDEQLKELHLKLDVVKKK